jgi:DNA-binding NarL/FixJ family response regulator
MWDIIELEHEIQQNRREKEGKEEPMSEFGYRVHLAAQIKENRDRKISELMGKGFSPSDIAYILDAPVETIRSHVARLQILEPETEMDKHLTQVEKELAILTGEF